MFSADLVEIQAWLFIIEGSITLAIAIAIFPCIPDYPLRTKRFWITHEQQLVVEWRIRNENAGIADDDEESMFAGLKQALADPKLYMYIVLQMSLITAQSFNNFFPSIVGTLGFNSTVTLLLTAPPYVFAFICSLGLSFHAAGADERGYHIAGSMLVSLLGNLLAMFVKPLGARYFSMFLLTAGSYSPYNLCVSWLSSSLPRPRAKRASALAIINLMGAGVAHFYTAYMFPDSQKPRYYAGGGIMSGACVVCACTALSIKYYLKKQNRAMEQSEDQEGQSVGKVVRAVVGMGPGAVVRFRYVH